MYDDDNMYMVGIVYFLSVLKLYNLNLFRFIVRCSYYSLRVQFLQGGKVDVFKIKVDKS